MSIWLLKSAQSCATKAQKQGLRFFTYFIVCCWWKTICQILHFRVCCSLHSSAWTCTLKVKEGAKTVWSCSIFLDLRKPENYILLSKCKAVDQTPVKLIDFGNLAWEIMEDQLFQFQQIVPSPAHTGKTDNLGVANKIKKVKICQVLGNFSLMVLWGDSCLVLFGIR